METNNPIKNKMPKDILQTGSTHIISNKKSIAGKFIASAIYIFLLSLIISFALPGNAFAWGPSTPSGGKWLADKANLTPSDPPQFLFQAEASGIYGYSTVEFRIENNGASTQLLSSSPITKTVTNLIDSPTDKSRWQVRFYKWDGVDSYNNKYGEGWTGWSSWAYFGVDSAAPVVPGLPNRFSPAKESYQRCSAASPLLLDWKDASDAMSGMKGYRLEIKRVATGAITQYYPTASQQSFTSLAEGWYEWRVYAHDNCRDSANAMDINLKSNHLIGSKNNWESAEYGDGTWRFYVDNTPPGKGLKQKPNYLATAGATVPHGINVAVNPNVSSPFNNADGTGNIDNPVANEILAADGKLIFSWTADTGSGIKDYNFRVTSPGIGTFSPIPNTTATEYNLGAGSGVFASLPNGIYDWNVTAYDKAGNSVAYDSNFKVVVDRNPPTVGAKTSPVAGFATSNPSIIFKWNGSTDNDRIRRYGLYIAPYAGNCSDVAEKDCLTALAKTCNITTEYGYPEGRYKWNVRAYDRAYNYRWYLPDFDFIYDKTNPQPGNKVAPHCEFLADGQINMYCTNSSTVVFSWTAATDLPAGSPSGIQKYELYVDNVLKYSGTGLTRTVTGLAQGIHTWNVKAIDNAGNFVFYNPDWQFKVDQTVPIAGGKILPVNNFKTKESFINFQWGISNDVGAGASGVNRIDLICVSGPVNFTTENVKTRAPISGSSYSTEPFGDFAITKNGLTDGVYTWNVKAYDRAYNNPLLNPTNSSLYDGGTNWRFTIDTEPPIAGNKVAPQPPNVNTTEYPSFSDIYIAKVKKVTFQWTAASDEVSAAAAIKYRILINKGTGGTLQYEKSNVVSPFINDIDLPDGDYNWNITAIDEAGNETQYGTKWYLKIDTTPPAPGEFYGVKDLLADPYVKPNANGIDVNTSTPTFIWSAATDPNSAASGIDRYRFVIEIPRGTVKFDTGYTIDRTTDATYGTDKISYKLPDANALADDGPYYWSVWVRDVAGNTTKYLQQWNFYVDTFLAFDTLQYELLVSRENSKVPGSPALYQPSPAYEVLVSGAPPKILTNEYTPLTDIVPSAPDPANNTYGTTFYWSVRNQDITGLWGKYEDYAVNIVTLYSGELLKPVDKSYSSIKPKFEWSHAMPQEVRRRYRLLVFKNAWPATNPLMAPGPLINYLSDPSPDGLGLPLEYQSTIELADGKYFWSIYATDDMGRENKYIQTWSFEIMRNPIVTMASQNLKWYAGYPNGIFVDAFGANGFETLGTCEVTLYKDAAGTQPIRKLSLMNGSTPAKIECLDGDTANRMDACAKLYSSSSFVATDINFPSNKRYLFNIAPHYSYVDKYGTSNKIYAKTRVYFYDKNNPASTTIYTDYPTSGTIMVGEVENRVKLRPYDASATEDTASVLFAFGIANSKRDYTFLSPTRTSPPASLQYVSTDAESDDARSIFYNGMAFFESPHAATSTSLSVDDSFKLKTPEGEQYAWRITNLPNTYNQAMRTKLFKNPDYIPQNTYDFMKILAEFSGTTPVSVTVCAPTWTVGDLDTVKTAWGESEPEKFNYLDRCEDVNNDNTLTKFETWLFSSPGDSLKLTYAADMASQIFLNGEAVNDQYNLYNQDESQHRQLIEVPLSVGKPSMLFGWNHLVIYVLHQKKTVGNNVNGLCYKLEGYSRSEAFKGAVGYNLWHSFPMPQPNTNDFANNGRGTSIVVYNQVKDGAGFKDVLGNNLSGSPAVFSAHKGIFYADKSALDKIVASKPIQGGDHKIALGIVSNEVFNQLEPRFSTSAYGENGYIKMHINQTPYTPDNVNRINKSAPVFVCPEPYKDVESIATLKPNLSVDEDMSLDPDNPLESGGFHHSMYYDDYFTQYPQLSFSLRTDEVRYIYAIDESPIEENFYDINWVNIKYKMPVTFTETFTDYFLPLHTVETAFTKALDEAHNVNGVISPIYNYRVWARDEHGELQKIGSPARRFCIDLTPPVVADIQVYYDREGVRLDSDTSPFVESDKTEPGTNAVALLGHTLTLWAFCTDEITVDPRKFQNGKFFIRRNGFPTDPWVEVEATCEVDTTILFEDPKFIFNRIPEKHPNGYYWFAVYTIPYDSDLTYYDVDFQVSDALGNHSQKLSESSLTAISDITKRQFKVGTIGLNKISVSPTLRSTTLGIFWQPFVNWRDSNSVNHYIVSIGDLTPNPFETSNWVDGSLSSCTREIRTEGKLPIFIMPVEKIGTVGFGVDYNDHIYSFEDPKSFVNYKDGWVESHLSGGYFSADVKKVKEGMYSWSNFMNPLPDVYTLYKDYNIAPDVKVAFGAWIKKETITSSTKLQAICYNNANEVIEPNASNVTFETDYDSVASDAWVHYYLNVDDKPYFITPPGTRKIRVQLSCTDGSKVYVDQFGFASYAEATVDFTPPQKPDISIGVFNHHNNTYDSATVFGYWDGQWDIKGSAWLDEPSNFPTLLSTNLVDFIATSDTKKVGHYSYKVINDSPNAAVGYFKNADIQLNVEAGDVLRVWANFQSVGQGETKRNIENFAIAFSDGTAWNTRVFYGNDSASLDTGFTAKGLGSSSYYKLGPIPDANTWVPLDINISDIGLEGRQISGLAFALSGTYENALAPITVHDTIAVYVDFIDIHSGAGVKNYLPQLEINRDTLKTSFQDLSTMKTENGIYQSGFMVEPTFDDEEFKTLPQVTNEVVFTDKLALLISSEAGDSLSYPRTGLTPEEAAGAASIALSKKLKLEWPSDNNKNEIDYNGGALVVWTYVNKVDYARDSVAELNIGIEYSTLGEDRMLTVAKYRAGALSPKSKRPPDFFMLRETKDLSSDEVRVSATLNDTLPLYKITDSFETELSGSISFKNNFIDAGRMPPANGEWVPLVIPAYRILPDGLIVSGNEKIKIKSLSIEAANCSLYVDHIGRTVVFKQIGDWQGNVGEKIFVQDTSILTQDDIHSPEQTIDGTESIKLKTTYAGEKNFYLRLKPPAPPTAEEPGFDPVPYQLVVPETGGILSLNVYLGTNETTLPEELMLEFHRVGDPAYTFHHRAYWGAQNIVIPGIITVDTPAHYYMGSIPDARGGWSELLIPTEILKMNNFKFDGINIRAHSKKAGGFETWIDRLGMLGVVPHAGENVRHSVYTWNLDDYVFYSMRIKSWDWVLNESGYAYSKYVRSKDRTPPLIEASMPARINYKGLGYTAPMGGVYYVKVNGDGSTAEVPLVFNQPGKEVDLSITTEDYLSYETIDSSRSLSNRFSIGSKKLASGESVEIILTQPTARDPLPSAEYISSQWLPYIEGLGMVPEKEIVLNDIANQWSGDSYIRYSESRYYFMNKRNYIARQIVYDDEGNFVIGGDTYIDVTPGPMARLAFYYPTQPVVDVRASEPALINGEGKDEVNESSKSWVGVTASDAMGNPVLKGQKLKFKWSGYYKALSGNTYDMNASLLETKRRMEIVPNTNLSYDATRPFRTYYEPPPRPYFQILRESNSVELAKKLLTQDQVNSALVTYTTQEVEMYSYTGYNIKGEAYEVGVNTAFIPNNLGSKLKSGDAEAFFVTTTRAGDVFSVTVSNEDDSIVVQSSRFRVVPAGIAEMIVEPEEAEIEAEHGQASFSVKGFDQFRNRARYKFKYHNDTSFDTAYNNDNETSTYEYLSTNEIIVNPLWVVESHEVEYVSETDKYNIINSETVGVFLSEGRTSNNTFGAGWEHGTREIWLVDTTEIVTNDAFGNNVDAAASYTGSQYLSSGAELRYGIQSKGWDLNDTMVFAITKARIIVKPLLKGYLSFKNHDEEPAQSLDMNAVIGNTDFSDVLKFYIQTFSDRGQITNVDSITEVLVQVDTSEDELARLFNWPVTDLAQGTTELRVKLDYGSATLGLAAYNSRNKPKIKLYYLANETAFYSDIMTPDKRAQAVVNVYPNKLDHIFFEPDISNVNSPFTVVKGRSVPIRAYGYDYRGNMITPLDYQTSGGWNASVGEVKEQMKSATHLMAVFSAKDLVPPPGSVIPVELTLKSQADFKKLSAPKDAPERIDGVLTKNETKGYLRVVNFGMFDFPCIYQELDADKLDKNGEYELSFLYTTGNDSSDARPAQAYVGVAYLRNADAKSVQGDDIHMLYSNMLNSGGKIANRPFKIRFKMDGRGVSQTGKAGVNSFEEAKKIIVFLGAPPATGERPALRYDHVTIERVK